MSGDTSLSDVVQSLISEIGESEDVGFLARHIVEELGESEPMSVNNALWKVYEQYHEEIDDRDFWLPLARAAEEASEGVEDESSRALILDTVAHLFHLSGKLDKAIDYQEQAVEASGAEIAYTVEFDEEGEHKLTGTQNELKQFLDQLRAERDEEGER